MTNSLGMAVLLHENIQKVLNIADYVATHSGGDGAVRDFIKWLVE